MHAMSRAEAGRRRRSWIFRYVLSGRKRRDMGLGSLNDVTLVEARETARDYRKLIKQGIDPINHRNALIAQNLAKSAAVMSPESGHQQTKLECPLTAKGRHRARGNTSRSRRLFDPHINLAAQRD